MHYVMDSHSLEEVSEEKDIGVFIYSDNLKPARQCQEAYNKASKALGIIARTILFKDKVILLKLYKSLADHILNTVSQPGHHTMPKTKP